MFKSVNILQFATQIFKKAKEDEWTAKLSVVCIVLSCRILYFPLYSKMPFKTLKNSTYYVCECDK